MKTFAIIILIVVMGVWALALCFMVYWRAKYRAETRDLERENSLPHHVDADGPEVDFGDEGEDDELIY